MRDGKQIPDAKAAEVCITRTTSNSGPDYMTVVVQTPERRIIVDLSLADFALALTGRAGIRGEFRERVKKTPE